MSKIIKFDRLIADVFTDFAAKSGRRSLWRTREVAGERLSGAVQDMFLLGVGPRNRHPEVAHQSVEFDRLVTDL
jgi:hypothetical protein